MEQFKTKKPSRFNTWCAMATFRLCDAEIEEQHHCNLIQGKGCSRKQFGRYVAQYPLSDEAVGMLIDAADNNMLFFFLEKTSFDISDDNEAEFVKKYGIVPLVRTGRMLSEQSELILVNGRDTALIGEYIRKHGLHYIAEETLFETGDTDFLKIYAATQQLCAETQEFLIINGKEDYVRIYATDKELDDDAYTELCRSASDDLVIFYLEHRLTCPTAKEFKFLLKRKNPQIIKVLDRCFDDFFDTEMLKLLLKENDDGLLLAFIETRAERNVPLPDEVWHSLFAAKARKELLKDTLRRFSLPSYLEVKLLLTENKELLDCYLKHGTLQNFGFAILLAQNDRGRLTDYLKSHRLQWQEECMLIDQKDNELLECYLTHHALSPFALGYRIKSSAFAEALNIVQDIEDFDDMVLSALLFHNEREFWEIYLKKCDYDFDEDFLSDFLRKADKMAVLDYLNNHLEDNTLVFCFADGNMEDEAYKILFRRHDSDLDDFLLQHGTFSRQMETFLIQYAESRTVRKFLETYCSGENSLGDNAEKALILRGDGNLIGLYLSEHSLSNDEAVRNLAVLLNPDLLDCCLQNGDYRNNYRLDYYLSR